MRLLVKTIIVVSLVLCITVWAYLYFTYPKEGGDVAITLIGQSKIGSVTTILLSHPTGADPILGEDMKIEFKAYLGGRAGSAEFVEGEITVWNSTPSISWENAPTVTEVSIANVPGDMVPGEIWELSFQVGNENYFVDVAELRITITSIGACVFHYPSMPPPS